MQEIKQLNKEYNSGVRIQSLLGKKVRDSNGKDVGLVTEVRLDPKTLNFDGIEMDRGLFGTYTFIGRKYITTLSEEGAVLNMNIVTDYKGLKVFDSDGKEVGTVKEVQTDGNTNSMSAIIVGKGIFKKDVAFPRSEVRGVGKSVMLNVKVNPDGVRIGG
jgi:sporulation protein YlmC with PRC-barrel domain